MRSWLWNPNWFCLVVVVVVVVVVVFILDLAGLTTCSALQGVPAHAMFRAKVNIQILKPILPQNEP
jgi:hypothetical protein